MSPQALPFFDIAPKGKKIELLFSPDETSFALLIQAKHSMGVQEIVEAVENWLSVQKQFMKEDQTPCSDQKTRSQKSKEPIGNIISLL